MLAFLAILLLLMGVEKFMNIKQHRAEEEFWEETKDAAVNTENVAEADEGGLFSAGLKTDEGTGKEEGVTAGGSGDEGITHIRFVFRKMESDPCQSMERDSGGLSGGTGGTQQRPGR